MNSLYHPVTNIRKPRRQCSNAGEEFRQGSDIGYQQRSDISSASVVGVSEINAEETNVEMRCR